MSYSRGAGPPAPFSSPESTAGQQRHQGRGYQSPVVMTPGSGTTRNSPAWHLVGRPGVLCSLPSTPTIPSRGDSLTFDDCFSVVSTGGRSTPDSLSECDWAGGDEARRQTGVGNIPSRKQREKQRSRSAGGEGPTCPIPRRFNSCDSEWGPTSPPSGAGPGAIPHASQPPPQPITAAQYQSASEHPTVTATTTGPKGKAAPALLTGGKAATSMTTAHQKQTMSHSGSSASASASASASPASATEQLEQQRALTINNASPHVLTIHRPGTDTTQNLLRGYTSFVRAAPFIARAAGGAFMGGGPGAASSLGGIHATVLATMIRRRFPNGIPMAMSAAVLSQAAAAAAGAPSAATAAAAVAAGDSGGPSTASVLRRVFMPLRSASLQTLSSRPSTTESPREMGSGLEDLNSPALGGVGSPLPLGRFTPSAAAMAAAEPPQALRAPLWQAQGTATSPGFGHRPMSATTVTSTGESSRRPPSAADYDVLSTGSPQRVRGAKPSSAAHGGQSVPPRGMAGGRSTTSLHSWTTVSSSAVRRPPHNGPHAHGGGGVSLQDALQNRQGDVVGALLEYSIDQAVSYFSR